MAGRTITIKAADGGEYAAYVSVPASGGGAGLLVFQEAFGVNAHMRSVADRFAAEGYVAIAPDVFWRIEPGVELDYGEAAIAKGLELMKQFDPDQGIVDAGATLAALRALPECQGKVGVVGFCLGGGLAYLTAARHDVDVAIGYYGVGIETHLDEADAIGCPLVLHFAGEDRFVTAEAVARIDDRFAARSDAAVYLYADAQHGFNSNDRAAYNPEVAATAYARTLEALRGAIGPA